MSDKKNSKKVEDEKEKAKALAKQRMEKQEEDDDDEKGEEVVEEDEEEEGDEGAEKQDEEEEEEEEVEVEEVEEDPQAKAKPQKDKKKEEADEEEEQDEVEEEEEEEEEHKEEKEKEDPQSLAALKKSDPEVKNLNYEVYEKSASSASVQKAKKALTDKFHEVSVVKNGAEALDLLKIILGDHKSSISLGFSTTLEQIGFHDYLKSKEAADIKNYKGEAAAFEAKGDMAKAGESRILGLSADIFFTGAAAVSEDGVIVSGDASSTRIAGLTAAKKKAVVVVGANKIVKDEKAARARLYDYQLPLESARARIAYAKYGSKGSQVAYEVAIKTGSAYLPKRIHVIIIEGQSFGY